MSIRETRERRIGREINVTQMLDAGDYDEEAFRTHHEHELRSALGILRRAINPGLELGDVKVEVQLKS